jgi:hypothetical protein
MNYRILTPEELLRLWNANRNGPMGLMAADELLNRIHRGDLLLLPPKK